MGRRRVTKQTPRWTAGFIRAVVDLPAGRVLSAEVGCRSPTQPKARLFRSWPRPRNGSVTSATVGLPSVWLPDAVSSLWEGRPGSDFWKG